MNEQLNQKRQQKVDCDLVIRMANKNFLAHREVLTKRLRFFEKRISTEMFKEKQTVIVLEPEYVIPEVFEHVLQYIYISQIKFTIANLEPIYRTAIYLEFDDLLDKAEKEMRNVYRTKLKTEISIKVFFQSTIRKIAVEHNLISLENGDEQFSCSYPILGVDKKRISYENLQVLMNVMQDWKEEMFHLCEEWVRSDQINRSRRLPDLLQLIPLEELSTEFLNETVLNNDIVQNNNKSLLLLIEALTSKPRKAIKSEKISGMKKRSLKCSGSECLYVLGGYDFGYLSSVSKLDSQTNEWTSSTPMPSKRRDFGCAVIDWKIYICGGRNKKVPYMNELAVYDTDTEQWTHLQSMKYTRRKCAMAALDGFLYVAGGYNYKEKTLSVVERYSVEDNEWEMVVPMSTKRSGLELVSMNGFLYAMGGHMTEENGDRLNSVERYSPQTNQWEAVASLNQGYSLFGSAVLNNRIYVIRKNNCEVYTPEDDKWHTMPATKNSHPGKKLAAFNDKLLAMGGFPIIIHKDGQGTTRVERFDFDANSWISEPDMDVACGDHGVAVVKS